jgi:predicted acylesterase/phospholipase RssA
LTVTLLLQGCGSLPERNPLPEESYAESRILGTSGLRFWADQEFPFTEHLTDDASLEDLRAALPGLVGREIHILAVSGGGGNGAFAAGLMNGWTASGTRPDFNIVTGISTGSLIAPFVFLGPDYDDLLEQFYTQYSTDDLIKRRSWLKALRTDARFDTSPMRRLIAKYVDSSVMEAIASEYRKGRLLFIGTTNMDAARPVTWDIGAIANSGQPGALELIHDVMLASASIPVIFPPVLIEAEANGQIYDEMHVDGGVSRQAFLFNLSAPEDSFEVLQIVGRGKAYVIRNSKLEPSWQAVDRSIMAIAGRSAGSLVRTQGTGDLYREFIGAHKYDFDFHLAYIPNDFEADTHELFDREYMRKLYKLGYEMAAGGYPWESIPPGIDPR